MSTWERVLAFTSATPFTGTWMRIGTAATAILALVWMRRMLPREDRHHGGATLSFLFVGLALSLVHLAFVAVGAGKSPVGNVLSTFGTFFVALGATGTVLLAALEIVPARANVRFPSILRDLVQVLAFLVIVLGLLRQAGLNVKAILTGSAVLTAILGLALQSTLSNLFAGIALHMDRSMGVGDWVQVGQRVGRIAQIRWRSTILRNADGDTVIIPNGQITTQEVYNFSRPTNRHRTTLRVGFQHRHPPNEVRRVLRDAAASTPGVLQDPPPDAFPVDFGETAVFYTLRYWIEDMGQASTVDGELRTRLWYAARRAGLEMPSPTRASVSSPALDKDQQGGALDEKIGALRRVDLFAPLEPSELELLARGLHEEHFAAGEAIIRQGEPGDSLFVLASGKVRVSLEQNGRMQDVATLKAGDFFGEMSLMTGEPRAATCIAASDTLCYVIDHATFQRLLTTRPQLADQMSSLLAARQAALVKMGGELSALAARAALSKNNLLVKIRQFFELE